MKKIFLLAAVAALSAATLVGVTSFSNKKQNLSEWALANVEALTGNEGLDCSYVRKESSCTINVGADGQIKLFSGTILNADANGEITFQGKVVCSSGGTETCRPVECVDLYEAL